MTASQALVRLACAAAMVGAFTLGISGASAGSGVQLEAECRPDEVRPHEFVLITCEATVTNPGNAAVEGGRIQLLPPAQLRITFPIHFDQRLDGQLLPNQPHGPNVAFGEIAPGQSRTLSVRFIASPEQEGDYGLDFQLFVGGRMISSRTARFTATPDAAAPPTDLELQVTLMDELSPLPPPFDTLAAPLPEATYDLAMTNRSQSPMDSVSVSMRFQSDVAPTTLDPMPSSENRALGLAMWDLSDFGRTSLGPGEELHVRVAFVSATPNVCTYVRPLAIAEAPAGEFAAPPTSGAPIGTCEVVDDEGHMCFFLGGLALPYVVSCELNQVPCYPAGTTEFSVPPNGIVCISVFSSTPEPTEPAPTSTPRAPVAGLPEARGAGPTTGHRWLLIAALGTAALSMMAIGFSFRKRRL